MEHQEILDVKLVSFGFKHGVPDDVNYLWDVRCLPNPHWVEALRPGTGLDREVASYVIDSQAGRSYLALLEPLLLFLVRQSQEAGKKTLHIAVGCTGGRHRSVAIVEVLRRRLETLPINLQCRHRDIAKGG